MIPNPNAWSYAQWKRAVDQGQIAPAYFFFGPEEVLIGQALSKLKEKAVEKSSLDFNWDLFRADADDMNWAAFADALTSLPLIPARRVVVLKSAGKAAHQKVVAGLLERTLQDPPSDLTLVMIEEEPDFQKIFYKKLVERCIAVAFPFSKPAELQALLRDFAASFGKQITDAALERVLSESAPGLRDLLSKMEVLVFSMGERQTIDVRDVEECTAFSREMELYNLLDALGRRDGSSVRATLHTLLQQRAETGALIFMLYRQIWALYRMKYLQEKKTPAAQWQAHLDLRPAFLEKRYRQYLTNYTRRELGKSLEVLALADEYRKTSALSEQILLWWLLENLLNPLPEPLSKPK
jgi:DNA polymerase-3 subunit delta